MGPSVHEMYNPLYLNAVLQRALQSSLRGHLDNPDINFVVHRVPTVLQVNSRFLFVLVDFNVNSGL